MKLFQKIRSLKSRIQFNMAKRQAEEQHARTNERFYVIPSEKGKLVIMDRKNFRMLKRKKYFSQQMSTTNLMLQSYYYTPDRAGKNGMTPESVKARKEAFSLWKEKLYRQRKRDKKKRVSKIPQKE